MFAVFEDGSHQYRVQEGDVVEVDFRTADPGARLEFGRVLLYQNADDLRIGQPTVDGARVLGEVVEQTSVKLYIQHFRRRKNYRRLAGTASITRASRFGTSCCRARSRPWPPRRRAGAGRSPSSFSATDAAVVGRHQSASGPTRVESYAPGSRSLALPARPPGHFALIPFAQAVYNSAAAGSAHPRGAGRTLREQGGSTNAKRHGVVGLCARVCRRRTGDLVAHAGPDARAPGQPSATIGEFPGITGSSRDSNPAERRPGPAYPRRIRPAGA